MLITCPSCGRTHDSAKYRGAFEIECDCGYSILIPDEDAINSAAESGGGFQAPPIAMDEEDSSIAINIETGTNVDAAPQDEQNPFAPFDGATDMTPEADLPGGMIYDPDEAQALADSKNAWSQDSSSEENFLDPFEPDPTSAAAEEPVVDDMSMPELDEVDQVSEPVVSQPVSSPARALLERNQSASLGHLVGSTFDLNLSALNESQLLKMAAKCEELLKNNPWIKQLTEENHSKCAPEDFINHKKIKSVPEVLALELFLYGFEIGGKCSFAAAEGLELHSP